MNPTIEHIYAPSRERPADSLAANPGVDRACRSFARRWGGTDPENAYQEARLAILILERHRFAPLPSEAIGAARQRLRMACRREIRDRARLRRYGEWISSVVRERFDILDIPAYLGSLTGRQGEAVRLRLWESMSEAECGAAMCCSPNTATQHYRAAIKRLRSLYADSVHE